MILEKYFDTHSHYHDTRFTSPQEDTGVPSPDVLLPNLFDGGLCAAVDIGTDIATSTEAIALAERYPGIYAAVGMYPGSCPQPFTDDGMEELIDRFAKMLRHEKVVAIGEIGLDFHYDDVPRDIQMKWFERQMQLAHETRMPVIIHDREAHGSVFDMLSRFSEVRGILHSYSGSAEMAKQLIKIGYLISVSGVVTFKNAQKLVEVVAQIPLEYLLIETDCPYLTPHPHRGKVNHSGYLPYTVARIAEIKGIFPDEVARVTRENAEKIFGIRAET